MSAIAAGNQSGRAKGKGGRRKQLGKNACPSCAAANQVEARFCQSCGRSMIGGGAGWSDRQTLTVFGAAAVSLVTLGLLFAPLIGDDPVSTESPAVVSPSRTEAAPAAGQPPDLSTMSPREAADRLFNRVMMADEQGDQDQVSEFAPMAVAAYDRLESLDPDALYHVGLIHAAAGDAERALDATQRLKAIVPGHLLASLLEHRLAVDENDQEKAERAIDRFKKHYDDEIKIDRLEYRDHQRSIDLFREEIGMAEGGAS